MDGWQCHGTSGKEIQLRGIAFKADDDHMRKDILITPLGMDFIGLMDDDLIAGQNAGVAVGVDTDRALVNV